jgi:putative ABC transport system ATP-binding protein
MLIELKDITKVYREKSGVETSALNGVSLSIDEGEFVAIAGPSGSGKTTLLNIIGAIDKPTSGTVIFDGKDITKPPVHDLSAMRLEKIGFVFQSYNLFPALTAIENVEYIMLLRNTPQAERVAISMSVLEKVGLTAHANKRPGELSGGQQRRVAVARALAAKPKVILADEPTANLDSVTAEALVDFMRQLNREEHISFVFSTHDKMVMEKADRVIHVKDGKVLSL